MTRNHMIGESIMTGAEMAASRISLYNGAGSKTGVSKTSRLYVSTLPKSIKMRLISKPKGPEIPKAATESAKCMG